MQEPIAVAKGPIDQEKKDLKYTHEYPIKNKDFLEDLFPDQEPTKIHECGAVLTLFTPKERGYAHLTGRFPIKLS